MICAHINETTFKEQSVKEHLNNITQISSENEKL